MPRLALVTGATSGLGKELCEILSEQKIPLFLTGRDVKYLQEAADRYNAGAMPLDLRSSREPLLQWIRDEAPDLVINNAGFALYGPVIMHTTQSQMNILEVNGAAAIEISIEAARSLYRQKKEGVILNISSAAGVNPFPTMAVYAAAKSLLTSFSKSFDTEMKPYGIRILAALPGQIVTPFAERASLGLFSQRPSWTTLEPRRAAEKIWKQIQAKKGEQVIDFRTRAALAIAKLMPRALIETLLQKSISNRYSSSL
jgi:uncharacterized protein